MQQDFEVLMGELWKPPLEMWRRFPPFKRVTVKPADRKPGDEGTMMAMQKYYGSLH